MTKQLTTAQVNEYVNWVVSKGGVLWDNSEAVRIELIEKLRTTLNNSVAAMTDAVKDVEALPQTTKGHYGKYMNILAITSKGSSAFGVVCAMALQMAGANTYGVKAGFHAAFGFALPDFATWPDNDNTARPTGTVLQSIAGIMLAIVLLCTGTGIASAQSGVGDSQWYATWQPHMWHPERGYRDAREASDREVRRKQGGGDTQSASCGDACKAAAVVRPPAAYVYKPAFRVTVRRASLAQMQFAHMDTRRTMNIRGHSDRFSRTPNGPTFKCSILIHHSAGPLESAALYRHELAHCNGWEH